MKQVLFGIRVTTYKLHRPNSLPGSQHTEWERVRNEIARIKQLQEETPTREKKKPNQKVEKVLPTPRLEPNGAIREQTIACRALRFYVEGLIVP